MKKYNFQEWLNTKVSHDPEVILEGKLEYLRLYLTDAMRELRTKAGLTQAQLAEKLGVQQAAVSKLESALKDREFESVLRYLQALGADLLVAVKSGDELYQVSDSEGVVLVDVPVEVRALAEAEGMSLREYVLAAIKHFSQRDVSVIESFLESDEPVALKVRERLGGRAISELAAELERCLSLSEEDERIFAVKNLLAGGVTAGGAGMNRDSSDGGEDEIELLDLAEELLEKLGDMGLT